MTGAASATETPSTETVRTARAAGGSRRSEALAGRDGRSARIDAGLRQPGDDNEQVVPGCDRAVGSLRADGGLAILAALNQDGAAGHDADSSGRRGLTDGEHGLAPRGQRWPHAVRSDHVANLQGPAPTVDGDVGQGAAHAAAFDLDLFWK